MPNDRNEVAPPLEGKLADLQAFHDAKLKEATAVLVKAGVMTVEERAVAVKETEGTERLKRYALKVADQIDTIVIDGADFLTKDAILQQAAAVLRKLAKS